MPALVVTVRPFSTRELQRFWTSTCNVSYVRAGVGRHLAYSVEEVYANLVKEEGPRNKVDHNVCFTEDERNSSDEGCLSARYSDRASFRLTKGAGHESQHSHLGQVREDKEGHDNGDRGRRTLQQRRHDGPDELRVGRKVEDTNDGVSPCPAQSCLLGNVARGAELALGGGGKVILGWDDIVAAALAGG